MEALFRLIPYIMLNYKAKAAFTVIWRLSYFGMSEVAIEMTYQQKALALKDWLMMLMVWAVVLGTRTADPHIAGYVLQKV